MERWNRYSLTSLEKGEQDPFGKLLISSAGQRELNELRLLNAGVDTVRQLYQGEPCLHHFNEIIEVYNEGKGATMNLFDVEWAVGAGAAGSGFRYRLQNNELGVIVFFQARHTKIDTIGTHLKIELSPHFIQERSPQQCQDFMYNIAAHMLSHVEPIGCAIHLALDVQGWEPPKDFMERFVTRSKKIMRIDGIDDLEFAHNTIATTYGRGETYMFGTAGALQCCIYNKTLEAKHRDKMHFWEGIWQNAVDDDLNGTYNPEETVWRIELRFHQSVLREFAQGIPCNVDTGEVLDDSHGFNRFIDVVPHLSGLWRTAMQSYRLDARRNLIDPAWQVMQEDARFYCHEPGFMYKRARKEPGLGNEKNVTLAFGNLISIYARQGFRTHQAIRYLQRSGMWEDLAEYYRRRGVDSGQFRQIVEQKLIERRLVGKAA
ncbi:hypothetical protein K8090_10945 [Halomonas meridiana]|jgi:hypothetical protein|uniref:Replication initiation factor n=1 Tax=Vreelandella aquamarina TaxID=77097 RepID=A0A6F8SYL0_9GAMM|nr:MULTISPECIES: hypothetical protein [Halomonas]MCD1652132.1 hypothetical protein [Halomonas axialensis]MCD2088262.1 hypothetical protein [Halomonas meridiana]BCA93053.1 hypothetical protein HMSLTHF_28280 [Halomonas meridiana]